MNASLDSDNSSFWNDICGSTLAREIGMKGRSARDLDDFDRAYFKMYPYLKSYFPNEIPLARKKALEVGLGYGTVGQYLASHGWVYMGIDIAEEPVRLMQQRLGNIGRHDLAEGIQVGSALKLPFADNSFDFVCSIGCLHHTGNIPQALSEIHRVLAPGGKTVIMLYNRYSFRRIIFAPLYYVAQRLLPKYAHKPRLHFKEYLRSLYDVDTRGSVPPYTEFVSKRDIRPLFSKFNIIRVDKQNFDEVNFFHGSIKFPRNLFLGNIAKVLGLEFYITAEKKG